MQSSVVIWNIHCCVVEREKRCKHLDSSYDAIEEEDGAQFGMRLQGGKRDLIGAAS
jgi:hypothetical protein